MSRRRRMISADLLKVWEERARGVYQETLQFVREGLHGLEVMAGKTMEVTKLRLANQKALHQIRVLFGGLGQRVYDMAARQRKFGSFRLPADARTFIEQITGLRKTVEDNINRLKHLTTVSRQAAEGKESTPGKSGKKTGWAARAKKAPTGTRRRLHPRH